MQPKALIKLRERLNSSPAWNRFWLVVIVLTIPFSVLVGNKSQSSELIEYIEQLVGHWASIALITLVVIYVIKLVFELFAWIWEGMAEKEKQLAGPLLKVCGVVAVVFFFAAYFRFEIAAVGDVDGKYYHYIVWDRWTGQVYADTARYKPKKP